MVVPPQPEPQPQPEPESARLARVRRSGLGLGLGFTCDDEPARSFSKSGSGGKLAYMWKRVALLLAVAAVIAGAYFAGVLDQVSDQQKLRALLTESGAWGPVVFVLLFAFLDGLGAPGILFVLTASIVWPFWEAFLLSLTGAVGAGVVGFLVARYLGRDILERYLPPRVRRYDEQLAVRGFQTVLLLRLLFFMAPWAHWMLGLSRVRFLPFLAGTILGMVPGMLASTFAGAEGLNWLLAQEIEIVAGTAMLVAAVVGAHFWWRRRNRSQVLADVE